MWKSKHFKPSLASCLCCQSWCLLIFFKANSVWLLFWWSTILTYKACRNIHVFLQTPDINLCFTLTCISSASSLPSWAWIGGSSLNQKSSRKKIEHQSLTWSYILHFHSIYQLLISKCFHKKIKPQTPGRENQSKPI